MSVGENVKRFREGRGMSQSVLADLVGVTPPMISMIERGSRPLTIALGKQIAQELGCSIYDIIGPDEPQSGAPIEGGAQVG